MTLSHFRIAAYACGLLSLILSAAMMVPMAVDWFDGNADWAAFFISAVATATVSILVVLATQGEKPVFTLRLGFLMVNAFWVVTCVVAALPFWLSGYGISFTDGVFEAVSGLTTTGSTVLSGLDRMPRGLLLWRSLTQWFGGIGIIAMSLILLPFLNIGGMRIFQMESSNRLENPLPRFKQFAVSLVLLYCAFSVACALCYALAGMNAFDAFNHAMTTISTGGFSTHDASLGYYGRGVHMVAIIFMIIGALPFIAMLHAIVSRDFRKAIDPQVPVLLQNMTFLALLAAGFALAGENGEPADVLLDGVFNIVSIITTTGFATTDYLQWGSAAVSVFFVATFLGGCSGSTSGGFKTYRLMLLSQTTWLMLKELIYPNGLFVQRYGGGVVSMNAQKSVAVFTAGFFALWLLGSVVLAGTGADFVTALSGMLTALTNTGPGLGEIIGPAGNFSSLSDTAKWILSAAMLLGRLEILTVLVLFSPVFWRG